MGSMKGKSGLVVASGEGIGRASAIAFAAAGANVLVSDVNDEAGQETVRLIREAGGTAEYLHANAASEADMQALVNKVVELWGQLDFAHNNAGVSSHTKPIVEQEGTEWEQAFAVNLFGMMFGIKHQMAQMLRQGTGGAIVNTSSVAGISGNWGLSAYNSSKWGVIGLTKTAAIEGAPDGIRVNTILPGVTLTPALKHWSQQVPEQYQAMVDGIPMRRLAQPEDQANAAVWLCSDAAEYVTGVALPVDGGVSVLR